MSSPAHRLFILSLLMAALALVSLSPVSGSGSGSIADEDLAYDQPGEAASFYRLKRVPIGESDVPVERYLSASKKIKRMPRYSTALNRLISQSGTLSPYAEPSLSEWVPLGPGNIGGRTRSILIDPREPQTMYAAGVAGGIWKSTDAGGSWRPLDDLLPNLAVSSMAMDQTDPQVIYAGTGEGFFNSDATRGLGVLKTTDGGQSWTHLQSTLNSDFYFVNRILISANDNRAIYAATSTGVWRSTDAGATWGLAFSPPTQFAGGCLDIALRTDLPRDHMLASFGNLGQATVYLNPDVSGAGAWTAVLAEPGMGRTSLAIAQSDQRIVYALASSVLGGEYRLGLQAVFKSTDGGQTWAAQVRNTNSKKLNTLLLSSLGAACGSTSNNQGWYDNCIAVDPLDPDRVWVGGVSMFRSDDGGLNWGVAFGLHSDQHAIAFHPRYNGKSNQIMFVGNDGGIYQTDNARAATSSSACVNESAVRWASLNNNYGVTQFYHGSPFPDGERYFGGTQDNGTLLGTDENGANQWRSIMGGDGGYVAVDPENTTTLYAETQNLAIRKSTDGGASFRLAITGISNSNFLFIVPFTLDPGDSRRLWTGGDVVWRTVDGAGIWTQASAPVAGGRVSAVAVSPTNPNLVAVGTSLGFIHRTDAALTSNSQTEWPAVQPRPGFVSWLAFDPVESNVIYATYTTFARSASDRHVYKSTDAGATWEARDGSGATGIPDIPVHSIVVDPANRSRLYAGTDLGVFVSTDGGASWARENTGFANTPTESLALMTTDGITRLFAFTHGRGAYRVRLAASLSRINGATVAGKKLTVTGEKFDRTAVILLNGEKQSTKLDASSAGSRLVAKKAGKKVASGQTVTLRVRNGDGTLTPEFSFTRP